MDESRRSVVYHPHHWWCYFVDRKKVPHSLLSYIDTCPLSNKNGEHYSFFTCWSVVVKTTRVSNVLYSRYHNIFFVVVFSLRSGPNLLCEREKRCAASEREINHSSISGILWGWRAALCVCVCSFTLTHIQPLKKERE